MRIFFSLSFFIGIVMSTGFGLFMFDRMDSLWLLIYNDVVMVFLSCICLGFVTVYCCRMRTVLVAFLEVSQVETTSRIHTVTNTGITCSIFLIVNASFELFMMLRMYALEQLDEQQATESVQDSTEWWLIIMAKHLVEIIILYCLLWTLWNRHSGDETSKRQYEKIPDISTIEKSPGSRRSFS
jgi:hypothetical protein